MTSPTYHADDDQLADEHDRAVPENTLTEPDTDVAPADLDLAAARADQSRPDTDLKAPDSDLAAPDADQTVHEDPAGRVTLASHAPAASIAPGYPGFTAGDDGAAEPGIANSSPVSPSPVSVAFTVPESVTESHLAGDAASADGPWNEIQAMFSAPACRDTVTAPIDAATWRSNHGADLAKTSRSPSLPTPRSRRSAAH